jgi:restriction system protein
MGYILGYINYFIFALLLIKVIDKGAEYLNSFRYLKIEKEKLRIEKLKAQTGLLSIIQKEEFLKLKNQKVNGLNAFEVYCGNLISLMGYTDIEVTELVADGGKDIIAVKDGVKYYVECKLWDWSIENHHVGRPDVQKLVGAMVKDSINKGLFITSTYFSNEAIEYADGLPKNLQVELIDGDKLVRTLENLREEWIPILIDSAILE